MSGRALRRLHRVQFLQSLLVRNATFSKYYEEQVMSSFTLSDPLGFDRDFTVAGIAGVVSGLVASLLVAIAGSHHHELMALSFGGTLGVAASFAPGEGATPILRVIASLAGGVVFASALPTASTAALLGGGMFGLALAVDEDDAGRLAAALCSAAAIGAAYFTTTTLFEFGVPNIAGMPVVGELLTGGVWGLFFVAAGGIRRLRWNGDTVTRELERAVEEAGEPERGMIRAARELYEPVCEAIERLEDESLRERAEGIVREIVHAHLRFSRRAFELREASAVQRDGDIDARIQSIDERLADASSDEIIEELEAARREYYRQSQIRERIETATTRLEVRQRRCVTALERLHMQLVEHGRADDTRMRLEDSVEDLDELTDRMKWRSLSVEEICNAEAPPNVDAGASVGGGAAENALAEVRLPTHGEAGRDQESPDRRVEETTASGDADATS